MTDNSSALALVGAIVLLFVFGGGIFAVVAKFKQSIQIRKPPDVENSDDENQQ